MWSILNVILQNVTPNAEDIKMAEVLAGSLAITFRDGHKIKTKLPVGKCTDMNPPPETFDTVEQMFYSNTKMKVTPEQGALASLWNVPLADTC